VSRDCQQGLAVGCSCGISQQGVTSVSTVRSSASVLDNGLCCMLAACRCDGVVEDSAQLYVT